MNAVLLSAWMVLAVAAGADAPADKELARMKKYYPNGYHFVDPILADGKVTWMSRVVINDEVKSQTREYASVGEFREAFLNAKVNKAAAVEVHARDVTTAGVREKVDAILKFLKDAGYANAGEVSN